MPNHRASIAFSLVLLWLFASSAVYFQPVKAQFKGDITINSDGSITQATMLVQQVDDIYFLSVDTNQSIVIQRSNMVFDGNNHALSGNTLYILYVSNVTVRNLTVANSYQGISIGSSSGVTITNDTIKRTGASLPFSETWAISVQHGNSSKIVENNFIDNMVGLSFAETFNNSIISNNISNSNVAFGFYNSSDNIIYYNNIFNNSIVFQDQSVGLYPYMASSNIWDNGTVGNFWSDYNGNGSYVIDSNNIDYHPLTHEITLPEFPALAILPLFLSLLFIAVVPMHRKQVKKV